MSDDRKGLGWLNMLIKSIQQSMGDCYTFYPRKDDVDNLKKLYQSLIQQKPEIDEKYVVGKVKELSKIVVFKGQLFPFIEVEGWLNQIISDVQGRQYEK
jgi:hypothetical protein